MPANNWFYVTDQVVQRIDDWVEYRYDRWLDHEPDLELVEEVPGQTVDTSVSVEPQTGWTAADISGWLDLFAPDVADTFRTNGHVSQQTAAPAREAVPEVEPGIVSQIVTSVAALAGIPATFTLVATPGDGPGVWDSIFGAFESWRSAKTQRNSNDSARARNTHDISRPLNARQEPHHKRRYDGGTLTNGDPIGENTRQAIAGGIMIIATIMEETVLSGSGIAKKGGQLVFDRLASITGESAPIVAKRIDDLWKKMPEAEKETLRKSIKEVGRDTDKIAKLIKETLDGKAARRITQGKWGETIDYNSGAQRAIDHIKDGHFFNSRRGSRSSRFSASNSTIARVKNLVDTAIAKGTHEITTRGDYSVIHTFDDVIGTDLTGRKTKTIQVFLDESGNIINAYPIPRR